MQSSARGLVGRRGPGRALDRVPKQPGRVRSSVLQQRQWQPEAHAVTKSARVRELLDLFETFPSKQPFHAQGDAQRRWTYLRNFADTIADEARPRGRNASVDTKYQGGMAPQGPEPLDPQPDGQPGRVGVGRSNADPGAARRNVVERQQHAGGELERAQLETMSRRKLPAHAPEVSSIAHERPRFVVLSQPPGAGDRKAPSVVA